MARARGNFLRPEIPVVAALSAGTELYAVLSRLSVPRGFPVVVTPEQARAALADRGLWPRRMLMRLPPELGAAGAARRAVNEACGNWGLHLLADRGRLVASELVTNAAEHACTPIDLMLFGADRALRMRCATVARTRSGCSRPIRRTR